MTGQRDGDRSGPEDREGQKITEQRDDGRLQRRQSKADNDRSEGWHCKEYRAGQKIAEQRADDRFWQRRQRRADNDRAEGRHGKEDRAE